MFLPEVMLQTHSPNGVQGHYIRKAGLLLAVG